MLEQDIKKVFDMTVGKTIRAIRLNQGMLREDLAAKAKISKRQIERIERGHQQPTQLTLMKLAIAFGFKNPYILQQDAYEDIYEMVVEEMKQQD